MKRTDRDLFRAVCDEYVYRSHGGTIMRQVRAGQNKRCDRDIRRLVAAGFVAEPPEGGSFFTPTEAGLDAYNAVLDGAT